jgi:hypothetical protein
MSRQFHWTAAAIAALTLSIPTHAEASAGSKATLVYCAAPGLDGPAQVRLEVVADSSRKERRLAVVRDGKEVGSIVVPPGISERDVQDGLKRLLFHPNGNDLAVGFKADKGSFVVVFLRQASGAYVAVDVSRVERVNIGVSGPHRRYYDVHTVPLEWLPRDEGDDSVQIRLQTRARDASGRRYRPTEPLIIMRDGRPLWR